MKLSDKQIDAITDEQWGKGCKENQYLAHRAYARAVERALRIAGAAGELGDEEVKNSVHLTEPVGQTVPGDAWQPIETAPKDGTEILAWREDCGVMMARYTCVDDLRTTTDKDRDELDEESLFKDDWFGGDSEMGGFRLEGSEVPTHWMPLPADPAECCYGAGTCSHDCAWGRALAAASGSQADTGRPRSDEKEPPDFCDTHCTWMDHHPDCERAAASQQEPR